MATTFAYTPKHPTITLNSRQSNQFYCQCKRIYMLLKQEYITMTAEVVSLFNWNLIMLFLSLKYSKADSPSFHIWLTRIIKSNNWNSLHELNWTKSLSANLQLTMIPSAPSKILIGLSLDSDDSKEALSWAIRVLAHPNDTIVAIHILG